MLFIKEKVTIVIIYMVCVIISMFTARLAMAEDCVDSAHKVSSTVVTIISEKSGNQHIGSGVIYDGINGYIVTNSHVLNGENKVKVILEDKQEHIGDVLGKDDYMDIAVVKIKPQEVLPQASMSFKWPKKDESVFAIGSPKGISNTIAYGKITTDTLKVIDRTSIGFLALTSDVPLEPGNSGGGLFDAKGRLVAITTAIVGDKGYCIPMRYIKDILLFLENGRHYEPPVSIDTYQDTQGRIIVLKVKNNCLSEEKFKSLKEDLKKGTQITSFATSIEFKYYSQYSPFLDPIEFYVRRDKEKHVRIPNSECLKNLQLFAKWRERVKMY